MARLSPEWQRRLRFQAEGNYGSFRKVQMHHKSPTKAVADTTRTAYFSKRWVHTASFVIFKH